MCMNSLTTKTDVLEAVNSLYRDERNLSGFIQRLRPRICPFEALLPLVPQGSRVLDIGCGSGLWAGLLVQTGRASFVHGFDASQKAIDVAQRMRERLTEDCRERLFFEYRSVIDGLPDKSFDVVTMIDVLHHIPPNAQENAVRSAFTCIRPGGIFLYKDMAIKPFFCAMMNRLHDLASVREWIHYCPISDVERFCNDSAHLEASDTQRLYWYQHEWRVFIKNGK